MLTFLYPPVARSAPRLGRGRPAQGGGRESLLFRTTSGAGVPLAGGPRGKGNGRSKLDHGSSKASPRMVLRAIRERP